MQGLMNKMPLDKNEHINDIAIIGMDGRFPGANNVDELWENIKNGINLIPLMVKDTNGGEASKAKNLICVKCGIDNIEMFDADFFGITSREAEIMDPQHRIFLEGAWRSLELAGYDTDRYKGSIALFAGCNTSTYLIYNILTNQDIINTMDELQIGIGNDKDHLATRTSYKLNLTGPCMVVQTSCSTSLVATHLACESLLNGQCDMALAGGVTLRIPQAEGYRYQTGGLVSTDGRCHTFDAKATGTVYSNGMAIVVLKRFEDALKDKDNIYAIIKGSAVNNDGADRVGYTAPGVKGQIAVIKEALEVSGINASTIGYIEAHGTGTPLGDVIEVEALTSVFKRYTQRKGFCALGSIKTNMGHIEMASGVSGLIKAALAVKYGLIPPSINFDEPNPNINWADSPFYVNTMLTEWKSTETPRRAGVSSLGLGGTNAHVVIEEPPEIPRTASSRVYDLMLLSAKTPTALKQYCLELAKYLEEHPEVSIYDAAFTFKVGRKVFNHRCTVTFDAREELIRVLKHIGDYPALMKENKLHRVPVIFYCGDNLSLDIDFARKSYKEVKEFKKYIDQCLEELETIRNPDLKKALFDNATDKDIIKSEIVIFAVYYSLARAWMGSGIIPQSLYGQGIGQLAAAAVAYNIDIKDCFKMLASLKQSNHSEDKLTINTSPMIALSGETGKKITGEEASSYTYWRKIINNHNISNINIPVIDKGTLILNINSLEIMQSSDQIRWNAQGRRSAADGAALRLITDKLGELWLKGYEPDWEKYYGKESYYRIPLPTYPFERKRYWIEGGNIKYGNDSNEQTKTHPSNFSRELLTSQFAPTSDSIQTEIAQIWEKQTGKSPIGVNDNFFELGGYSLTGISIITRINSTFQVELYLRDLFENPTISELAQCVANKLLVNVEDKEFNEILKEIEP